MSRKMVMVILMLLCLPMLASAQAPARFGAEVLFTTSDMFTDTVIDYFENYSGLGAGLFVELYPMPFFALRVAAEYVQSGFTEQYSFVGDDGNLEEIVEANSRLNYFSVPIYAKIVILPENQFKPFILGGPRYYRLVGDNPGVFKFPDGTSTTSEHTANVIDSHWGYSLGIGIGFMVKDIWLVELTATHSRDSKNVLHGPEIIVGEGGKNIINTFGVSISR